MTILWRYKTAWPLLLLDATFLYAFTLTGQFPWISYALLFGTGVGLLSFKQWLKVRTAKDTALGLLCFLLPFTTWTSQWLHGRKTVAERDQPPTVRQKPKIARPIPLSRRWVAGAVLAAFFGVLVTGMAEKHVINPALAPLESTATETLQRSLLLAASSYASARLIDRAIAFFAEAQVGVGVASFKPGQVFKPVQDMAVRYSDVMVLAMTSIGIQLLVMEMGQTMAMVVFGPALCVCLLLLFVLPPSYHARLKTFARLFVALMVVMRLGIPLGAAAVGLITEQVLDGPRQQAQQEINITTDQLQTGETLVESQQGMLGWMRDIAGQATELLDGLRALSDGLIERLIQLLVIYTMETLILPLVMLYIIWRLTHAYVLPAVRTEWPY